jgi:hypothetical protein
MFLGLVDVVELVVSESKQGFVNLNVKNGIENDYDE